MIHLRAMLLLSLALVAGASRAQTPDERIAWNRPAAPFRIIGNVHYVGTEGLSAYLLTGPKGHVLIDGGLPESAPLIAANIRALGFRLRDVKYLLINHTHFDHSGGLAELKRLTGATLVATEGEKTDLVAGRTIGRSTLARFPAVAVDRIIRDGDRVVLGPIVLTAIASPGHTRGGVSWLAATAGKSVLFATSLTVAGQPLVGDRDYPGAAADFASTFTKLRRLRADVFLNFHPDNFDLAGKRRAQQAGRADAFVDPGELGRQIDRAEQAFRKELAAQRATPR
ncbi:MAG: subclass B3 metallo-beta-lactamase [Sphingomonas sp.]|nr:subclass B3 metallo-beta-lactamase [Sphingomonas sp.]